jgi:hypothetical protein
MRPRWSRPRWFAWFKHAADDARLLEVACPLRERRPAVRRARRCGMPAQPASGTRRQAATRAAPCDALLVRRPMAAPGRPTAFRVIPTCVDNGDPRRGLRNVRRLRRPTSWFARRRTARVRDVPRLPPGDRPRTRVQARTATWTALKTPGCTRRRFPARQAAVARMLFDRSSRREGTRAAAPPRGKSQRRRARRRIRDDACRDKERISRPFATFQAVGGRNSPGSAPETAYFPEDARRTAAPPFSIDDCRMSIP